ncbi:MAG: hypothetical protein K2X86_09070 [Cytophagaceae bacterium]|nr:hypothetical protein [Cytophagaceae bacterium]
MNKKFMYALLIFGSLSIFSCKENNREPGNPEGNGSGDMNINLDNPHPTSPAGDTTSVQDTAAKMQGNTPDAKK